MSSYNNEPTNTLNKSNGTEYVDTYTYEKGRHIKIVFIIITVIIFGTYLIAWTYCLSIIIFIFIFFLLDSNISSSKCVQLKHNYEELITEMYMPTDIDEPNNNNIL